MDFSPFLVPVLIAFMAAAAAYVFVYPLLSGETRAQKRQLAFVSARVGEKVDKTAVNKREQVANSLKEIEAKKDARNKLTLELKIQQAGLSISKSTYYLYSLISCVLFSGLIYTSTGHPIVTGLSLIVGFFGIPNFYVSRLRKKRLAAFVDELPNAMDVIVRGIRSGLPIVDCLKIISLEAREPLRSEFRQVIESQTMGIPLGDAVSKIYERVPVSEANFFAIVIAIQQKGGGNLSEALSNLSRVLRARKQMKGKVTAMSMEAKASAAIIASMPIIVTIMIYFTSPAYISMLWTTQAGQVASFGAAIWMGCGILTMKNMINFDI